MKNKYLRPTLLSTVVFAFTMHTALAQRFHDYVITQKNDTIQCHLESQLFGLPKYGPLDKDILTKIDPDSIKEYAFHNKLNPYVAIKTAADDKKRFLVRLENGPICLYEFSQTTSSTSAPTGFGGTSTTTSNTKIEWYAAKHDDEVANIIKTNQLINFGSGKKQRKKNLADLLADEPVLLKEFTDADDYGFDAIRKAIQVYNDNFVAKK